MDPIQNNYIPAQVLSQILSHLPQRHLVVCREVCPYWRDVIDLHCPMKDLITLEETDEFLDRKLELRMFYCILSFFHKDTPNISLAHPQTIKSFTFCNIERKVDLNVENARDLLLQVKPFVEALQFDTDYLKTNILSKPYLFPKLRSLLIGIDDISYTMSDNLEILFSHRFPSLEFFYLRINYLNETLTDEAYCNFFNFLAKHRHAVKQLRLKICYDADNEENDLPDPSQQFVLSEEVKGILSKGQLQLEVFELVLPPKYVPAWAPIIKHQKKLTNLGVGYASAILGPGGVPFYAIAPGILSSICTLRRVSLCNISSVECDGMTWIPLDVSVFRDAVNLIELDLRRNFIQINHDGTPRPNESEGAWIIKLNEINSGSLKCLAIDEFVCDSGELQILVDNAPVLECLRFYCLLAPRTSDKFDDSGVHGGIVKSFVEKESKKEIRVFRSMNYKHPQQNEKLRILRTLYSRSYFERDTRDVFILRFP